MNSFIIGQKHIWLLQKFYFLQFLFTKYTNHKMTNWKSPRNYFSSSKISEDITLTRLEKDPFYKVVN